MNKVDGIHGSCLEFGNDLQLFSFKENDFHDSFSPIITELDRDREWVTKTVGHFHNISGQID